jgi:rhodanese-related sulfurtransferase
LSHTRRADLDGLSTGNPERPALGPTLKDDAPRVRPELYMEACVAASAPNAIEEVPVEETWARLERDPNAVLIDVRTQAEWAFVGLPDLTSLGKRPLLLEWSAFPTNKVHEDFPARLEQALTDAGFGKETELLFLCRSGGRSKMAAQSMAARGYARCRNVTSGFEGNLDSTRHRGKLDGWKAKNLPWSQG